MTKNRSLLPILITASICMVLGSTGGAVAGSMVTGKQIKDGSVTGKDVKDQSLESTDLSAAAVAALHGANGTNGAPGTNGTPGAPGAPGTPGANGVSGRVIVEDTVSVDGGDPAQLGLDCPAGKKLLSATGYWFNSSEAVQVVYGDDTAAVFTEGVPTDDDLIIQVVCATVAGARSSDAIGQKGH